LSILKEYLIQRMVVLRISTALITFSDWSICTDLENFQLPHFQTQTFELRIFLRMLKSFMTLGPETLDSGRCIWGKEEISFETPPLPQFLIMFISPTIALLRVYLSSVCPSLFLDFVFPQFSWRYSIEISCFYVWDKFINGGHEKVNKMMLTTVADPEISKRGGGLP
jgi:hypothetical protein